MKLSVLFSITIFLSLLLIILGPLPLSMELFIYVRSPKLITALLMGASLALSGLLLQTLFQNNLVGPFVIGINSGASLMVAIYLLFFPGFISFFNKDLGLVFAALIGSLGYLIVLLAIYAIINAKLTLVLVGLILSYFTSGLIGILVSLSNPYDLQKYTFWSLGSITKTEGINLIIFAFIVIVSIIGSILLSKHLNILTLGREYAKSMGLNYPLIRLSIILISSILAGTVTAYCGPIVFIGLLSPHLARYYLKTAKFTPLILASLLFGMIIAILSAIIMQYVNIPLNSILSLLALPIIGILIGGSYAKN